MRMRRQAADDLLMDVMVKFIHGAGEHIKASSLQEAIGYVQKAIKNLAFELSHDNGTMANKRSIAGGGHAVKFKVEGDSNYVTSASLHGSRTGCRSRRERTSTCGYAIRSSSRSQRSNSATVRLLAAIPSGRASKSSPREFRKISSSVSASIRRRPRGSSGLRQ